jgi:hypothetical protein
MQAINTRNQFETVTVEVHGQVLDTMSFDTSHGAEGYKRSVRQWAREKGIMVGIWSQRLQRRTLAAQARAG